MDQIIHKSQKLKNLDSKLLIFGAKKHQYNSIQVSKDQIEVLEEKLGLELPADYKNYLLRIGSGVGPYYGILSIDQILLTYYGDMDLWENYGMNPSPQEKFPYLMTDADEILRKLEKKDNNVRKISTFPESGCVPICHHGHDDWSFLITSGELRGYVWDVDSPVIGEGGWLPAQIPPGINQFDFSSKRDIIPYQVLTFSQWIEFWLDNAINDLNSLM